MDYSLDLSILKELYARLDSAVKKNRLRERNVFLFGVNTTTDAALYYLKTKEIRPVCILDNNKSRQGKTYAEIPVDTPKHALEAFDDKAFIMIGSSYYPEMCLQLEELGYEKGRHIFQMLDFEILKKQLVKKNKKEISPEEMRVLQLQMLDFLHKTCEENQLRYYLCGGTLLGAVRHQGYIPWDDDIDVAMPSSDLKKLIALMKGNKNYELLNPYESSHYYFECTKLIDKRTIMYSIGFPLKINLGVDIDIFPLIGFPEDEKERRCYVDRLEKLYENKCRTFYEEDVSDQRLKERLFQVMDCMEEYDFDSSRKIGFLLSRYSEKEIMDRSIYEATVDLEFEGRLFHAAAGYETYLKTIFGKYWELPPPEKRVATHQYKAYWREKI